MFNIRAQAGKAIVVCVLVLSAFGCNKGQQPTSQSQNQSPQNQPVQNQVQRNNSPFAEPISDAKSRVTKKPFGIFVSPNNSPVSPERFTGYHTGVDFETTPDEQNGDVPIYAICDGSALEKKYASGYGGVLVESCSLNGDAITVVYGHLRLASISVSTGQSMHKGAQFAVLGKGFSTETDGERKHLHLGIHKGSAVDIKGYVQNQSDLSAWINFADYLQ